MAINNTIACEMLNSQYCQIYFMSKQARYSNNRRIKYNQNEYSR